MNITLQTETHTNHKEQVIERTIAQWIKLHQHQTTLESNAKLTH